MLVSLLIKLLATLLELNVKVPQLMDVGVTGVIGHNVRILALMDNVLELGKKQ